MVNRFIRVHEYWDEPAIKLRYEDINCIEPCSWGTRIFLNDGDDIDVMEDYGIVADMLIELEEED